MELKERDWQGEGSVNLKVVGETGKRFATIEPGASVSHSYTIVAKSSGVLFGTPASTRYRPSVTSAVEEERECASTATQHRVLSTYEAAVDTALLVGTYATVGLLQTKVAWRNTIVLAVLFGGALTVHSSSKHLAAANKRRKQIRAEAELMKGE